MKNATKKPETLSFYEFFQKFPNEAAANTFFEERRWKEAIACPHCDSKSVASIPAAKPMPYRCRDCRKHFSVRTGTVLAESKLPLHKWLMAIYLLHTARKGVSSVQMGKELGITQKSAWFLDQRIREAMQKRGGLFAGKVEVDETYVGGKEKNKHASKKLHAGRGGVGKAAVFGMRQRAGDTVAFPVAAVDGKALKTAIAENVEQGSTIYSDSHKGYIGLDGEGYEHQTVAHCDGEYARGTVHTNGIESFWALLKRGHYGIYHQMSAKHLHRYVNEFSHRLNTLGMDTLACIGETVDGMIGRRLTYEKLIA